MTYTMKSRIFPGFDAQHPVAVFLTEVIDTGSAGFEDPRPAQPEHRDRVEIRREAESQATVRRCT
ncbi:hypothetical protein [Nocardia xishanensis]|uniref:Uncharacterized protein n=1 Tax=Nocardia xishanensis TaxID=238964 RepID=A0ABW7WU28_9NOCA